MLKISSLCVNFNQLKVIENFSYSFTEHEITVLYGPSGCGKTSLLNAIAKTLSFKGIIKRPSKLSYVFQEDRLLPWMTVYENLEFVLKNDIKKEERYDYIMSYLNLVGLAEHKDVFPNALSGGMKRRVAIARAFSYPSDLILMDEPFKGLDWQLKESIMSDVRKLWLKDKKTVLFVTHDEKEAYFLGDKILFLKGLPLEISYEKTL